MLIALAVAAIVGVLIARLRTHAAQRSSARSASTYERIERIRASRAKRR